MRLIDADRVKQYVRFNCPTEAYKEWTAEKIDTLFPTVEAIPVEWIQQYNKKHLSFGIVISEEYMTIENMLTEWEAENEKA